MGDSNGHVSGDDSRHKCSFGNHPYASIAEGGKSHVPPKLGRISYELSKQRKEQQVTHFSSVKGFVLRLHFTFTLNLIFNDFCYAYKTFTSTIIHVFHDPLP